MRKTYADLHVCPDAADSKRVSRMINKSAELGYNLIALTFSTVPSEQQLQQFKKEGEETGVKVVARIDLKPRTAEALLRDLRKYRRRFEVIAAVCESKNVARQAAKDRRVDLLNFPRPDPRGGFFDQAEAELASNSLACLEIDMKHLLCQEGRARIRLLSALRKEIFYAHDLRVPIVLSSGASDEMLMRKPKEFAALASLFGLDFASGEEAVSKTAAAIIARNMRKLAPGFVAPGIRVIRRGRDC